MADHDGPLFLIVTIRPRHDKLTEAAAQLQSIRRNAEAEDGCVFMHLLQPQDEAGAAAGEPDVWTMVEQFASRAAWDEHMASEHNRRGNAELDPLLRQPSELRLLTELA